MLTCAPPAPADSSRKALLWGQPLLPQDHVVQPGVSQSCPTRRAWASALTKASTWAQALWSGPTSQALQGPGLGSPGPGGSAGAGHSTCLPRYSTLPTPPSLSRACRVDALARVSTAPGVCCALGQWRLTTGTRGHLRAPDRRFGSLGIWVPASSCRARGTVCVNQGSRLAFCVPLSV